MTKQNSHSPDALAEGFLNARFKADSDSTSNCRYTVRSWRNAFYRYEGGHYVEISADEMKTLVTQYLIEQNRKGEAGVGITTQLVNNVLQCIRGIDGVHVPESTEPDSWVSGTMGEDIQTLAFNNGLLIVYRDTLRTVFGKHTPDYFTLTKLPYDYDPNAKCPRWLKFLDEVMEKDTERIELLQQWAGYILTNDLRQHKFLLCVGEGANGKSVFFDLIERLVGRQNCSHVNLAKLGDRFALGSTYGKKVNSSTESNKDIDPYAETILKALTSGDPLTFEWKYRAAISAVPTAKVMIATNELPRFQDKSGGVWRRILLVPFERTFTEEQQNKNLANELAEELPGIFNWALEGMRNLSASGGFIEPERSKELLAEYRRDVNPARTFLEENYEESVLDQVSTTDLYSHYKKWCQENGYTALNDSNLGKEVKRRFPEVNKKRVRMDGKRVFVYEGLAPREDANTDAEL